MKLFIRHKNIKTNIFKIQANNSMYKYFCIGFTDFMLAGKRLTDYTSLLLLYDFEKKMIPQFWVILKMNERNSIEAANTHFNLSDQTKFRLNEINKIKYYYFNSDIQERKIMSKKFIKNCCFWLF